MVLPVHDVNPVRRTPGRHLPAHRRQRRRVPAQPDRGARSAAAAAPAAQCRQLAFLDHYAAKPVELIGNDPETAVATGAGRHRPARPHGLRARPPPPYDKPPVLSALTAMFLHGGWLHLLGNMLFLYVFGNNVEDRLGRLRFLLFYLVCGYAATYGFAAVSPSSDTPLVGASGAIAGVLGAYLVLFPRARVWSLLTFLFFLPVRLPAWLVLGSWFVLQALYSGGRRHHRRDRGGRRRLPRPRPRLRRRGAARLAAARHRHRPAAARVVRSSPMTGLERFVRGVGVVSLGLAAVGLAAPRELASLAGVRASGDASLPVLVRLNAARQAVLGLALLTRTPVDVRRSAGLFLPLTRSTRPPCCSGCGPECSRRALRPWR